MDRKREKDGGEQHRPRQRRPEVSLTKFPSTVSAESPRGGNANGIARRGRQRIMDIGGGAFVMRMHTERGWRERSREARTVSIWTVGIYKIYLQGSQDY